MRRARRRYFPPFVRAIKFEVIHGHDVRGDWYVGPEAGNRRQNRIIAIPTIDAQV
jgi:hypothetical protein